MELNNLIIAVLVPLISVLFSSIYAMKPSKQETSRKMFEKCYVKIKNLIDDTECNILRDNNFDTVYHELKSIIKDADFYYHHRIAYEISVLRVDNWITFKDMFEIEFAIAANAIGLPVEITIKKRPNRYPIFRYWKYRLLNDSWIPYYLILIPIYMYSVFQLIIALYKLTEK